jgi:hypothetical protein
VVDVYPSPAGATESLLPLESEQALADDNPVLRQLDPDVEALLVNRVGDFGIRGFDLACALLDGYDAAILVDVTQRGGPPGTVSGRKALARIAHKPVLGYPDYPIAHIL